MGVEAPLSEATDGEVGWTEEASVSEERESFPLPGESSEDGEGEGERIETSSEWVAPRSTSRRSHRRQPWKAEPHHRQW